MLFNTNLSNTPKPVVKTHQNAFDLVPAARFSVQELTDIYNETRVDYVVPMPMNKAKLQAYIDNYDVDLTQSWVAMSKQGALGLGLLGRRGDTTWVTRLGVTPQGRKKGVGRKLMAGLLDNSRKLRAKTIILEVIKDNKPAQKLFKSLGFQPLRDLLVIRRPPTPVNVMMVDEPYIKKLDHEATLNLLQTRTDTASWVSASESMMNAGNLSVLVADIPNLGRGWLAYQNTTFQLGRVVLETEPDASLELATLLLQSLHQYHPLQDTVIENLAADDRHWPVFQALGYFTSFVRVEMELCLTTTLDQTGYNIPFSENALASPLITYLDYQGESQKVS